MLINFLFSFLFFLKLFVSQRLLSCLHNAHLFSFFLFKNETYYIKTKNTTVTRIYLFLLQMKKKTLKDKSCFNGEF